MTEMPTLLIRLRLSASMDSGALSKGKYCIKITTGTSSSNDRTLAAKITFASGSDSIVVADGADYAKGSTVLEQCYSEALADVQNPTTNAWTESIESSTDGSNTYAATICDLVDGGCTAGSDGISGTHFAESEVGDLEKSIFAEIRRVLKPATRRSRIGTCRRHTLVNDVQRSPIA